MFPSRSGIKEDNSLLLLAVSGVTLLVQEGPGSKLAGWLSPTYSFCPLFLSGTKILSVDIRMIKNYNNIPKCARVRLICRSRLCLYARAWARSVCTLLYLAETITSQFSLAPWGQKRDITIGCWSHKLQNYVTPCIAALAGSGG